MTDLRRPAAAAASAWMTAAGAASAWEVPVEVEELVLLSGEFIIAGGRFGGGGKVVVGIDFVYIVTFCHLTPQIYLWVMSSYVISA